MTLSSGIHNAMDCDCSKSHGWNHGLFLWLFKLSCILNWIENSELKSRLLIYCLRFYQKETHFLNSNFRAKKKIVLDLRRTKSTENLQAPDRSEATEDLGGSGMDLSGNLGL